MADVSTDEIDALAREIEDYLDAHPEAADTLTGIANWWLPRQRLEHATGNIERALNKLVERGTLMTWGVGNGTQVYAKRRHIAD